MEREGGSPIWGDTNGCGIFGRVTLAVKSLAGDHAGVN